MDGYAVKVPMESAAEEDGNGWICREGSDGVGS